MTKLDEKGEVLVSVQPGTTTVLLNKTFRMVEDFRIDVLHFMNPDKRWICWAINGLRMSMLNDRAKTGDLFGSGDISSSSPTGIQYRGVMYLYMKNFQHPDGIHLCDKNGQVYAGSNIYGEGHSEVKGAGLCLGRAFNPFDLSCLDLLFFNNANKDLSWRGGYIEGRWIQARPKSTVKIFEATSWPTWIRKHSIPEEVVSMAENLWPPTSNEPALF